MFVQPKKFPETPLDTISSHSGPISFLNDQTQPMVFKMVDGDADSKVGCPGPTAVSFDPCVFCRLMKPFVASKPLVLNAAARLLGLFHWSGLIPFSSQTLSRFRPFARRRLMTSRPARVDMRSRNPCVLFLFKLLG